jgi:hypothetical protein
MGIRLSIFLMCCFLLGACQTGSTSGASQPEVAALPDEAKSLERDRTRVSSASDEKSAELWDELWQKGVSEVHISFARNQECVGEESQAPCRSGEEWIYDRSQKRLKHEVCDCGSVKDSSAPLSIKQMDVIEAKLRALNTTRSPVPCAGTAPRVLVEFFPVKADEPLTFPVNYGQCGTQNQLFPRIDVQSFEQLMAEFYSVLPAKAQRK